jgi:hypothetical protein
MSMPHLTLTPEQLTYAESSQWKTLIKQFAAKLRCAAPGIVESFNADNQTVSVQIALSELAWQGGVKPAQWTALQPVDNVPIMFFGGGGFTITVPLKQGDEGMLIFCDTCIDGWWANGGIQPPDRSRLVQPQIERRRHDLHDCGFYPGMKSQPNMLNDLSTTSLQIRSNDGTVVIEVAANQITMKAPKVVMNTTGDTDATASGNANVAGAKVVISSSSDDVDLNSDRDANLTATRNVNLNAAKYSITGLASYANNAAALVAGLTAGQLYRNGDCVGVVH